MRRTQLQVTDQRGGKIGGINLIATHCCLWEDYVILPKQDHMPELVLQVATLPHGSPAGNETRDFPFRYHQGTTTLHDMINWTPLLVITFSLNQKVVSKGNSHHLRVNRKIKPKPPLPLPLCDMWHDLAPGITWLFFICRLNFNLSERRLAPQIAVRHLRWLIHHS